MDCGVPEESLRKKMTLFSRVPSRKDQEEMLDSDFFTYAQTAQLASRGTVARRAPQAWNTREEEAGATAPACTLKGGEEKEKCEAKT